VAMIHWRSIGPLLIMSLAIMGSPGPATSSLTAIGSTYGVRRSLASLVGIILGTTIVLSRLGPGFRASRNFGAITDRTSQLIQPIALDQVQATTPLWSDTDHPRALEHLEML
jgi:hypothetical protein